MKIRKLPPGCSWWRRCYRRQAKTARGHYGRRWRVVFGHGKRQIVCRGCATPDQMRAMSPSRQRQDAR